MSSIGLHIKTFFITIFICCIALYVFIKLRLKAGMDCDMPTTRRRRYLRRAKTGDVLCVAYGSKRAKLIKVFTGSMWAHSAIVIRDKNGEPHVLEAARYSQTVSGILATPLKQWLHKNKNYIVAYRPYRGAGFNTDRVKEFLVKTQDDKIDMFVVNWLKSMYKVKYTGEPKNKYYCSEFVTHFFQEMDVIKKKYNPAGYKPWELLYGYLQLTPTHEFGDPRLLTK